MLRSALVLAMLCSPAFGSETTEQFTGTSGNAVTGWTVTPTVATFAAPTFKYGASSTATVGNMALQNFDHGATMDSVNGTANTIELLSKFKPSGWDAGGNMVGPFALFSWVEDLPGQYCNHGMTMSVQDGSITIHEWYGLNELDECERVTYSSPKDAGFAVTDTWYIARLRISGTAKKLKVWRPDLESEPFNWEVDVDSGWSYTGNSGIMMDPTNNLSATLTIDWFVAATDGDTATNPDGESSARRTMVIQ